MLRWDCAVTVRFPLKLLGEGGESCKEPEVSRPVRMAPPDNTTLLEFPPLGKFL